MCIYLYRPGGKYAPEKPKTAAEMELLQGASNIQQTIIPSDVVKVSETVDAAPVVPNITQLSSKLWSELL